MDLLSAIRRWHHRDQLPIRENTRRTGLSRNTIRKYLANGEISPMKTRRSSNSAQTCREQSLSGSSHGLMRRPGITHPSTVRCCRYVWQRRRVLRSL